MDKSSNNGSSTSMWTLNETMSASNNTASPHNKFLTKRMSETSKSKVVNGGSASLSVVADDILHAPFPEITVNKPENDVTRNENENNNASMIRVTSARKSKTLDNTDIELGEPSEEFQKQIQDLVHEMTNKVLIHQPQNIYEFLAEYLEDKHRRETKKGKGKKRNKAGKTKGLKRSNSQLAMKGVDDGDRHLSLDLPSVPVHAAGASPEIEHTEYGVSDTDQVCMLTGSTDVITQCCFFKNYVIASSEDTNVRIFDKDTGKQKLAIPNHKPVNCFVLVPIDDKKILILIGSADGQVPGWRVRFGTKCSAKFTVMIPMHQPNPIRAMTVSPRGKYMASGCCFEMTQISLWGDLGTAVRGTLKTWDMDSIINYVDHPQHYYDDVEHICLKTYKQIIARGVTGQKVMSSYARLSSSGEDESSYGIKAIAFTPDDSQILVGFGHPTQSMVKDMKMIALLDSKTLETLWLQYAYFYQINNVISSPEKSGAASGPWNFMVGTEFHLNKCTVEIRPGEEGENHKVRVKFPWRIDFDYGNHQGGAFSPDGSLVATVCGCNLVVFKSYDGQQVASYEGHTRPIAHVSFSEDGKFIATAGSDKTIRIWNAPQKITSGLSFPSPRHMDSLSPRRKEKDGIGKPVSLSPNLYVPHALSPTESEAGSRAGTPDPERRLSWQDTFLEMSPSVCRARGGIRPPKANAFEQTLNHIHIRAERARSPSPNFRHKIGEKVTS